MTHAQLGMDKEVHRKFIEDQPKPSEFKIKRFVDDVDPRTSTVRGDQQFALRKTQQAKASEAMN